jgi:hypothetical protein
VYVLLMGAEEISAAVGSRPRKAIRCNQGSRVIQKLLGSIQGFLKEAAARAADLLGMHSTAATSAELG